MSEQVPIGDAHMTTKSSLTVTDHYVKVAEGRPVELIRSFDTVETSVEAGSETKSNDELEKLEGKKVSFKWNADNSDYDVAYHETEGDAKILEHLAEDMDLRKLLPDRSVKEGDKWEVDAQGVLSVVVAPMRVDNLDLGDAPEEMSDVIEEVLTEVKRLGNDVKTVCEYKGSRDVDGKSCAAVAIKVDGKPSMDLAGVISNVVKKQIEGSGQQVDFDVKKATVTLEIHATGELLWNLADGHVYGFSLAPTVQINADFDMSFDAGGESHHMEASVEASAKGDMSVATK
jgi:hypothetical protein